MYFSIVPTAYFLHVGYTESLFIALTIASFYYTRREKWLLSSFIGMFAFATRITEIILLPALIVEYFFQKGFQIKNIKKEIFWLVLVPFGFVFYLIINFMTFGDPFMFLVFQKEHWRKALVFPWKGFLAALDFLLAWWRYPAGSILKGWAEVMFGVFGYLITIWVIIRFRTSFGIYMLISWLIITSTSL